MNTAMVTHEQLLKNISDRRVLTETMFNVYSVCKNQNISFPFHVYIQNQTKQKTFKLYKRG
jgi:hypothetical protein